MTPGPVNAIMGDEDFGTAIPETQIDDQVNDETKKMAKFTRTAEYKRQKEWGEQIIQQYQQFLPDGRDISSVPMAERADRWTQANEIIRVIKGFLASYDQAAESAAEMMEKK